MSTPTIVQGGGAFDPALDVPAPPHSPRRRSSVPQGVGLGEALGGGVGDLDGLGFGEPLGCGPGD